MIKKLMVLNVVLAFSGLKAMKEPRDIQDIIKEDDVHGLQVLLETDRLDPNEESADLYIHSPLSEAVQFCSLESVKLLLEYTTSEKNLRRALLDAFDFLGKPAVHSREKDPGCRFKIAVLMIEAAKKRGFKIQEILDQELRNLVKNPDANAIHMRMLLDLGADRFVRLSGYDNQPLIPIFEEDIKTKIKYLNEYNRDQLPRIRGMIKVLRTYAPDLKTRTALSILNQVREGKLTKDYFNNRPLDLIELIAKLASIDPEAQTKWIKLGMPSYEEILAERPRINIERERAQEAEPMDISGGEDEMSISEEEQ